ncbi:hypothetical protein V6N12_024357 [Hibiscus sabdariffa]|uniref:HNH nuclease domain-containing protein n=1 Tax=Hibiscus sabdariffa TaxID=183260 RepID=A0ABR2G0F0_9ROSI
MQWKVSSPAAADEQNALHSHVRCRLGWVCNPIHKPPIDIDHIHHRDLSDEEETFVITLWNNRFDWLPEDCTPIEGNNFNCSPEYTEWFNNNGKQSLVAHEVSQSWHREQRVEYMGVNNRAHKTCGGIIQL